MRLSVVIPAQNEEGAVGGTAREGVGAVRVVEQDQPTEGIALGGLRDDVDIGVFDLGAQGVAVRREPLRWSDRAELDFRAGCDSVHGRHRIAEWGRFG